MSLSSTGTETGAPGAVATESSRATGGWLGSVTEPVTVVGPPELE